MKYFYLLIIGLFSLNLQAQVSIDFDNMTPGDVSPQSPLIEMWPPNPLTDAQVTNQEYYSSPYSMQLRNNNTDDIVINLGNKDSGLWVVTWQMYVPTGNVGYWNIQENENATPSQWNGEFFVGATSSGGSAGVVTHNNTSSTASFPHDTWFTIEIIVNLDTHIISIIVDENYLLQDAVYEDNSGITGNQLGAINFYSIDTNNNFYVDDFELYETCENPEIISSNTYPYICEGDYSVISVTHSGEEVYWYDEEVDGTLLGSGSPFTTDILSETTSFWAEAQNQTGLGDICSSAREEIVVVVIPTPEAPIGESEQEFESGQTLADLEITGTNLTWYADGEGNIELPETTPLVHDTTYYVSQSEEDCEGVFLEVHVTETLNVLEVNSQSFIIYPNPVQNFLYIESELSIDKIKVYSISGQQVFVKNSNNNQTEWDISQLKPGLYFAEITTDNQSIIKRLIKR